MGKIIKKNTGNRTSRLSPKEKAKLIKKASRRHKLPPNKVEEPKKTYKRDKTIETDE